MSRLSIDSNRPPTNPAAQITSPTITESHPEIQDMYRPAIQTAPVPQITPVMSPSSVLPGDTNGAMWRRPHNLPPTNDAVSNTQVPNSTFATAPPPCGSWRGA